MSTSIIAMQGLLQGLGEVRRANQEASRQRLEAQRLRQQEELSRMSLDLQREREAGIQERFEQGQESTRLRFEAQEERLREQQHLRQQIDLLKAQVDVQRTARESMLDANLNQFLAGGRLAVPGSSMSLVAGEHQRLQDTVGGSTAETAESVLQSADALLGMPDFGTVASASKTPGVGQGDQGLTNPSASSTVPPGSLTRPSEFIQADPTQDGSTFLMPTGAPMRVMPDGSLLTTDADAKARNKIEEDFQQFALKNRLAPIDEIQAQRLHFTSPEMESQKDVQEQLDRTRQIEGSNAEDFEQRQAADAQIPSVNQMLLNNDSDMQFFRENVVGEGGATRIAFRLDNAPESDDDILRAMTTMLQAGESGARVSPSGVVTGFNVGVARLANEALSPRIAEYFKDIGVTQLDGQFVVDPWAQNTATIEVARRYQQAIDQALGIDSGALKVRASLEPVDISRLFDKSFDTIVSDEEGTINVHSIPVEEKSLALAKNADKVHENLSRAFEYYSRTPAVPAEASDKLLEIHDKYGHFIDLDPMYDKAMSEAFSFGIWDIMKTLSTEEKRNNVEARIFEKGLKDIGIKPTRKVKISEEELQDFIRFNPNLPNADFIRRES